MQVNMYGAAIAARKSLAEQTRQQRNQSNADQCDTAASQAASCPGSLLMCDKEVIEV